MTKDLKFGDNRQAEYHRDELNERVNMAETGTKRQNVGGKAPIATPKSAPNTAQTATISLEDALNGAIGSR